MTAETLHKLEPRNRPAPIAIRDEIENRITMAVFLCTILVFSLLTFPNFAIPAGTISEVENRTYSGFPPIEATFKCLRDFPTAFEKFFGDRFAMRQQTIQLLGALKFFLFQTTATPYVIVGHDDWLFFRGDGEEFALRHWPLFSETELRVWGTALEQRRAWLAKRNIKFLFVVVPTKSNVYPEFVPTEWKPISNDSRSEQLCRYLKQFTKVECLNLQGPLLEAKPMGKLYFQTDTHWDPLGAYFGYRAMTVVLRRMLPSIALVGLKDSVRIPVPSMHGDLLGIAGLGDLIRDSYETCDPKVRMARLSSRPGNQEGDRRRLPFALENDNPKLPTAYFVHDSFLMGETPFISESFRRAYFEWESGREFDTKAIVAEQPDVLVEEMTERYLTHPPPINPPDLVGR